MSFTLTFKSPQKALIQALAEGHKQKLCSAFHAEVEEAVLFFKDFVSKKMTDEEYDYLVSLDLFPIFLTLLRVDYARSCHFNIYWYLTNIVSKTGVHSQDLIDRGLLKIMKDHLLEPTDWTRAQVKMQIAWLISNLACDNALCRDRILDAGLLYPLLRSFRRTASYTKGYEEIFAWMLNNVVRSELRADHAAFLPPLLDVLTAFLYAHTKKAQSDAVTGLGALCKHGHMTKKRVKGALMDRLGVLAKNVKDIHVDELRAFLNGFNYLMDFDDRLRNTLATDDLCETVRVCMTGSDSPDMWREINDYIENMIYAPVSPHQLVKRGVLFETMAARFPKLSPKTKRDIMNLCTYHLLTAFKGPPDAPILKTLMLYGLFVPCLQGPFETDDQIERARCETLAAVLEYQKSHSYDTPKFKIKHVKSYLKDFGPVQMRLYPYKDIFGLQIPYLTKYSVEKTIREAEEAKEGKQEL